MNISEIAIIIEIKNYSMKHLCVICLFVLSPLYLFSQNLEVEGQAKITVMNSDPTAQSIVVKQVNGTLAVRDASTV